MKINDVIQLTESESIDQRIERATKTWTDEWKKEVKQNPSLSNDTSALQQYGASLSRDSVGKKLFDPAPPTKMDAKSVEDYIRNIITAVLSTGNTRNTAPVNTKSPFVVIDDNPLTISYGRQTFILAADNQWRYFGDNKQRVVDPTTSALLNKQRAKYQPNYSSNFTPPSGARDVRSKKGMDLSSELFVAGHGVVKKDEDGTWYSLVTGKDLADVDIPYANEKLAQQNSGKA
jgi:hypothetical protein